MKLKEQKTPTVYINAKYRGPGRFKSKNLVIQGTTPEKAIDLIRRAVVEAEDTQSHSHSPTEKPADSAAAGA